MTVYHCRMMPYQQGSLRSTQSTTLKNASHDPPHNLSPKSCECLHECNPQCSSQVLNGNCCDVFLISCAISNSPIFANTVPLNSFAVERTAFQQCVKQTTLLPL